MKRAEQRRRPKKAMNRSGWKAANVDTAWKAPITRIPAPSARHFKTSWQNGEIFNVQGGFEGREEWTIACVIRLDSVGECRTMLDVFQK